MSSYEVAGLVWHFADADLAVAPWEELAIVAAADRNLAAMVGNQSRTMALKTPDGTRCVIDTQEKFGGLALLSFEVSQLREAIANELNPHLALDSAAQRRRLVEAYVP
ncbi:hypothetical protein [Plastoroseomonas hellenica]|uniref:hypothetical protein n=1 Tax=Plastoroseomonas hellenica TaxID=2687306 RepID=UPI001BA82EE8|nr:hypothetical protein [Plastoroseomonas hellenica]